MRSASRSLRVQLAVLGFLAIALPTVVLLGVSVSTEATVVVDGQEITEGATSERSPWVIWTAVAMAPLAAVLAWRLAGRAVRPIDHIRSVATDIEATDLSARIALTRGPTEVVALADSFDAMLERVERAVTDQRRLIDEASHELRTPLTVLRTNADVLLAHPQPTHEDYRAGLLRTRTAALRLQGTVDDLLVDARQRALDHRPTDLGVLARTVAADLQAIAAERTVSLDLAGSQPAPTNVDEPMVMRAFVNLVLNAIEWSPPGGTVTLTTGADRDDVVLIVADEGPGVPVEQREAIFERGWRADPSRPGAGLGLPLARHVATAHGGSLELFAPRPGGPDGATFELRLPRSAS